MNIEVPRDWWKGDIFGENYLTGDSRTLSPEVTQAEIDFYRQLVPIFPGAKVLEDFGGFGRLSHCWGNEVEATALDFSQFLVEHGKKLSKGEGIPVRMIQGDARRTHLEGEQFNGVTVAGNPLGYGSAEDDMTALREARRLLVSGGWLLVDAVNGEHMRKNFAPFSRHVNGECTITRTRELTSGGKLLSREVISNGQGAVVSDEVYGIQTRSPRDFSELVQAAGFCDVQIYVGFSSVTGERILIDNRIVVVARK